MNDQLQTYRVRFLGFLSDYLNLTYREVIPDTQE